MPDFTPEAISRVREDIMIRLYNPHYENGEEVVYSFLRDEDPTLIIRVLFSIIMTYGSPGRSDDPFQDTLIWWDVINTLTNFAEDAPHIYVFFLPILGGILLKNLQCPTGASAGDYIFRGLLKYGIKNHPYLIPGIIEVLFHETRKKAREEAWRLIQSFDEPHLTPYMMVLRSIDDCPL